ncbi:MAG TPA: hypothetical protein VN456_08675 [Desulfosporosinus sp.]|nr:hypothetical protein [Desulfosporosinus sp.]
MIRTFIPSRYQIRIIRTGRAKEVCFGVTMTPAIAGRQLNALHIGEVDIGPPQQVSQQYSLSQRDVGCRHGIYRGIETLNLGQVFHSTEVITSHRKRLTTKIDFQRKVRRRLGTRIFSGSQTRIRHTE